MPRPYSTDLRERAVEAVESGASRREIAEIFKVGVSSVVRWCQRWSETGSAAPKPSGGSVSPLEEHSDWILALIAKQPDLTLEEILAAMARANFARLESGGFPIPYRGARLPALIRFWSERCRSPIPSTCVPGWLKRSRPVPRGARRPNATGSARAWG